MADAKKPPYDLDKIVADLDPEQINDKVELKHRKARNKYDLKNVQIKDYNAFFKEATAYVQYHHQQVFGSKMPDHVASGRARQLLDAIYKKEGGIIAAFREAKKGNMGNVINNLASASESEERGQFVQHVMNQIDPQDFDGHVALAKQYVGKYKAFLPSGMKTKSPEQLAPNYEDLIHNIQEVTDSAKSSLKKYEPAAKKKAA